MKFLGRNDGRPLISRNFEAWKYGPVVPELYHRLKAFGNKAVGDIFLVTRNQELTEHKVIRRVVRHFSHMSPGELVERTHEPDGAWDQYYDPESYGIVIPNSVILLEYRGNPF